MIIVMTPPLARSAPRRRISSQAALRHPAASPPLGAALFLRARPIPSTAACPIRCRPSHCRSSCSAYPSSAAAQLPPAPSFRTQHIFLVVLRLPTAPSARSVPRCSPAARTDQVHRTPAPSFAQPELEFKLPQYHCVAAQAASLKSPSPMTEQVRRTPLQVPLPSGSASGEGLPRDDRRLDLTDVLHVTAADDAARPWLIMTRTLPSPRRRSWPRDRTEFYTQIVTISTGTPNQKKKSSRHEFRDSVARRGPSGPAGLKRVYSASPHISPSNLKRRPEDRSHLLSLILPPCCLVSAIGPALARRAALLEL